MDHIPAKNTRLANMWQPADLAKDEPLLWSTGNGTDLWAMIVAAITGDTTTITTLLDKNPNLVRSHYNYRPAITYAVEENKPEVVKLLLARGANPVKAGTSDTLLTIAQDRGYTAIQQLLKDAITGGNQRIQDGETIGEAIRSRDDNAVEQLLAAQPALVNARDNTTNQPIHWATMTRQPRMIDLLLKYGADINAQRADGARPIQLVNGDYSFRGWTKNFPVTPMQVLTHLQQKGAYVDICTACAIGDIDRVRELLDEEPALVNKLSDYVTYYTGSGSPIRNAAARGHIEIVKLLLDRGADPNLPEEHIAPLGHALHSAVCNGYMDIVKLLLAHGAYPNVPVESSADTLSAAMARGNKPMIELLCSHGAARAVNLLAYYGDVQEAAAVFAANPLLAKDAYALECAASQGHEAFVRLMLRYEPTLAKEVAVGVESREPEKSESINAITNMLFAHGMDANYTDWLGIKPLHRFAGRGDIASAAIFLAYGADINAVDGEICSTPLGWAAKYNRLDMAAYLLDNGANINPADIPGWAMPLAWAERRGHMEMVALLKERGAR